MKSSNELLRSISSSFAQRAIQRRAANESTKRPQGMVRFQVFENRHLIAAVEDRNLFVNAGLPALAALMGGDTSGEFATAIGFGSGGNTPTPTDAGLTAPSYYKSLDSHAEDGAGSVTFSWSLGAGDTGAVGITIQELGLFANKTVVILPGATQPTPMLARKTISPILFSTNMSLSGIWTLTF